MATPSITDRQDVHDVSDTKHLPSAICHSSCECNAGQKDVPNRAGSTMTRPIIPRDLVARQLAVSPRMLVRYERLGLVQVTQDGQIEGYEPSQVRRLWTIMSFQRDLGINLAGVEVILRLCDQMTELHHQPGRPGERDARDPRGRAGVAEGRIRGSRGLRRLMTDQRTPRESGTGTVGPQTPTQAEPAGSDPRRAARGTPPTSQRRGEPAGDGPGRHRGAGGAR